MQNFFETTIKPYLLYLDTHSAIRYLIVAVILLALAFLIVERKRKDNKARTENISAIAGEDVMATQLDLAKAYIEMGQKDLALTILKNVNRKGNIDQQAQAKLLIKTL